MTTPTRPAATSTPEATKAEAQTRVEPQRPELIGVRVPLRESGSFGATIGPGVLGTLGARPYERRSGEPLYRPLRIYTSDPAASRLEGSIAVVNVPYEPLDPGPVSALIEVDDVDGASGRSYRRVDLEQRDALLGQGREPSPSDPAFHQQMVYAVAATTYAAFKSALGRHLAWGFPSQAGSEEDAPPARLRLRPHAMREANAYYDRELGEIRFGYYAAGDEVQGRNIPGGYVFTCLSHDIIVHETTHALLDGLRAHFALPTGPDVLAFHEAFADLIAIFQRFTYKEVVATAVRRSRGRIGEASLLTDLAQQLGQTTGSQGALRTASDMAKPLLYGSASEEPHRLGSVLVAAIFEAFLTIYERKTRRYLRLATHGTGVLPEGDLPSDLEELLAKEAAKLASHFLAIAVRAIDYCPTVDLELGEYLRALITADYDLVPDDPWGYREALIDAFRRRRIYPRNVTSFSEDALLWLPPDHQSLPAIAGLTFAALRFDGDPCRPAGAHELLRQAQALGDMVARHETCELFGLAPPQSGGRDGDTIEPPCVQSVRTSRRVGPDSQVAFDLVAEVTQRRLLPPRDGLPGFEFYGGATVILGPQGEVRYAIRKNVRSDDRPARQAAFLTSDVGRRFWEADGRDRLVPSRQTFRLLHDTGDRDSQP